MKPEEKDRIIEICKSTDNPAIKSFPNYWTRFHNWEKAPPFILIVDGIIVGFTALTFQKRGVYANHYAFAVDKDYQRMGYGERLWEIALQEAKKHGCKKIKTKADERKSGFSFYHKCGWVPIGKDGHDFVYEADLENINDFEDFKKFCNVHSSLNVFQNKLI